MIKWRGKQLLKELQEAAVEALDEFDLRVETASKAELYPGHGKLYGTMQRSIQAEPARIQGRRVVGKVGTKGVPYALRQHKRFQYIVKGLASVRPMAGRIFAAKARNRAK